MNANRIIITALEVFMLIAGVMFILGVFICFIKEAKADTGDYLDKCRPYEASVRHILIEEGVDEDFYYLMVAESHCRQGAVSKTGAVGFWQMMPATMKAFGCSDANDLNCQTHAAAKYLKSLSERFETFDKIVAAWNMGGRNFARTGATSQANGLVWAVHEIMRNDMYSSNRDDAEKPALWDEGR